MKPLKDNNKSKKIEVPGSLQKDNSKVLTSIKLKNLHKYYRTNRGIIHVLKNINFEFEPYKNIGIMGRNGTGKTTLLKMIFGQLPPDKGSIDLGNQRLSWPIGKASLKKTLTARDNIKFICRIYDLDIEKSVQFVQDIAELGKFMDLSLKMYSSGMKARLAFAISAMVEFDCYLVDEGFNTTDEKLAMQMQNRFLSEHRVASMILVSHNPSQIRRFCDHAAILRDGQLHYYDDIEKAIHVYKNL